MKSLTIKTNDDLFNKFKALSLKVKALGAIVQSDSEINEDELQDWIEITQTVMTELNSLQIEVIKHVNTKDTFSLDYEFE